jgi:hypothetical protein
MNKYLQKAAGLLGLNVFKSSVVHPTIFNSSGRAIVKKPVGTLINPSAKLGSIKNKMGMTQRII